GSRRAKDGLGVRSGRLGSGRRLPRIDLRLLPRVELVPARRLEKSGRRWLSRFVVRIRKSPVGPAPSIAGGHWRCRVEIIVVVAAHNRRQTLLIYAGRGQR